MDNTNIVLAANIQKYRKKCGLTQEELAKKLGLTFQAVSKWENAKTAPNISFLPTMAELFGCYIEEEHITASEASNIILSKPMLHGGKATTSLKESLSFPFLGNRKRGSDLVILNLQTFLFSKNARL